MKTRLITLLIAITTIIGSAYAQKKIEVYKNGAVVYSEYVSDIDSVKFVTTEEQSTKTYLSTLNVVTGFPDEIEAGYGEDLGTLTEEVQIEINNSSKTIGLSIKGINLGELANIPSGLQAPFDIELQNVPYTETEGEYNVSYNPAINEEEWTTDVAIGINGNKAYLVSLAGSIKGEELQLNIFVLGDENLAYIPVNIIVNSPIKDNNEGSKTYLSTLNVVTGFPDEIEAGYGEDLGTLTEEVQIEINNSSKTIGLSIKGINLGELANIPQGLQAPFDIELQNIPYTETEGEYNVSYNPAINEEEMTTDVAIGINGNKAYLVSLAGSIKGEELQLNIFVLGDENLINIPVNIIVNSPIKDNNEGSSNTNNGHAYVDLGLSVKWATCNIGATSPEEYGDYFAWGETTPKTTYNWSTYKYCNGAWNTMTKYCTDSYYGTVDNKTTLELTDDAAHVNWGGSWRMPTRAEQDELRDTNNCTWTWTTQNGVNGYKVTSKKNGNSIFLPAAGYRNNSGLSNAGGSGYYWSSSLNTSNSDSACYLYFSSSYVDWYINYRFSGHSVRPVCE